MKPVGYRLSVEQPLQKELVNLLWRRIRIVSFNLRPFQLKAKLLKFKSGEQFFSGSRIFHGQSTPANQEFRKWSSGATLHGLNKTSRFYRGI